MSVRRLNVDVAQETHRALKLLALQEDLTMVAILGALVDDLLERPEGDEHRQQLLERAASG